MYFEFFKKSFQQCVTYRFNTIVYFFSSFIYLFVTMTIWIALYGGRASVDQIPLVETITYLLMVRFVEALTRNDINNYLVNKYYDGSISVDFIRPVNVKICAFAHTMGESFFYFLFFTIPMVVVGGLIWGFQFPSAVWQYLMFISSVILSFFIYGFIMYSMGVSVFWFKIGGYVRMMVNAFIMLFSGAVVPLWFYPEWLAKITYYLPFRYLIFEPINIFLGRYTFAESVRILGMQGIWVIIMYLFGRILWRYASRFITVQGG